MTSLGGLTLSDNLRLLGLRVVPISASSERSEGGVAHVLTAPLIGGRELQLSGFFTSAQVEAILAMAAGGTAVDLVHPRGNFSVLITACSLADWIEYVDAGTDPDDFEEGTITLLEIAS
jgi:hypothetical protein